MIGLDVVNQHASPRSGRLQPDKDKKIRIFTKLFRCFLVYLERACIFFLIQKLIFSKKRCIKDDTFYKGTLQLLRKS